jgi:hypothetical protein
VKDFRRRDGGKGTYFIESKHLACHLPAVVEGDAHSVIDQVLHFALLVRHGSGGALESDFSKEL